MVIVPQRTFGLRPVWLSYRLESVIVGIGGGLLMLAPAACLFVK